MTCKDCIHYEVCQYHITEETKMTVAECEQFKNEDDFVKVVRCKDCKYGEVSVHSVTKDGKEEIACYCKLRNAVTDIDGYCSGGRRSVKGALKEC